MLKGSYWLGAEKQILVNIKEEAAFCGLVITML